MTATFGKGSVAVNAGDFDRWRKTGTVSGEQTLVLKRIPPSIRELRSGEWNSKNVQ
jgi:hypothetical protein